MLGIITASMLSKRFPNKMTAELCGQPLIKYIINRAQHINNLKLIVATTTDPQESVLVEMANQCGVGVDRSTPKDIAGQFVRIGKRYNSNYLLRLNGDSPCFDIELIERGIAQAFFCDLVTNIPSRTYPYGISLEIIRIKTLESNYKHMGRYDREHVTPYFYRYPKRFRIKEILNTSKPMDFKFTIDYPEDIERLNEYLLCTPAGA